MKYETTTILNDVILAKGMTGCKSVVIGLEKDSFFVRLATTSVVASIAPMAVGCRASRVMYLELHLKVLYA